MMRQSDTIGKIVVALAAAQAEFPPAPRDGTNPHFDSRYATLSGILETIRPVLAKHGLAIVQYAGENGATIDTAILHISGEWLACPGLAMTPTRNDPQGIGSLVTYARRYGIGAALNLGLERDDDGNSVSRPPAEPTRFHAWYARPDRSITTIAQNLGTSAVSRAAEAPKRRETPPAHVETPDTAKPAQIDPGAHGTPITGMVAVLASLPRERLAGKHSVVDFDIVSRESETITVTAWRKAADFVRAHAWCVGDIVIVSGTWNVYRGRAGINADAVDVPPKTSGRSDPAADDGPYDDIPF